jgi:hypothetical protein
MALECIGLMWVLRMAGWERGRRARLISFQLAFFKDVAELFEGVLYITVPPRLILRADSK